jgi:hypothetical protein
MIIVGVDEVGRGCLVGNVVAGAVILPDDFYLPGLTDSVFGKTILRITCVQFYHLPITTYLCNN